MTQTTPTPELLVTLLTSELNTGGVYASMLTTNFRILLLIILIFPMEKMDDKSWKQLDEENDVVDFIT